MTPQTKQMRLQLWLAGIAMLMGLVVAGDLQPPALIAVVVAFAIGLVVGLLLLRQS